MKRKYRLRRGSDFKAVIDYRLSARTPSFQVYVKPSALDHLRVGISASKKIGNAVVRAKIRRQIRAFFAVYNMYQTRYDIVILARRGFTEASSAQNQETLREKIGNLTAEERNKK